MNLEGSLDAFGLPDVVSLLASRPASPAVCCCAGADARRSTDRRASSGSARAASCGRELDRSRASLVRRVVGSGAVDDAALRQAVARAVAGGVGVARALLEAGAVEPELHAPGGDRPGRRRRVRPAALARGRLRLRPARCPTSTTSAISLDPARVLAEAQARAEAWTHLAAVVPSADSVLAVPVVLHHDPEVTRDEWALLALVDGRRRVRDLVELTGCGRVRRDHDARAPRAARAAAREGRRVARPRHRRRAPHGAARQRRGRAPSRTRHRRLPAPEPVHEPSGSSASRPGQLRA